MKIDCIFVIWFSFRNIRISKYVFLVWFISGAHSFGALKICSIISSLINFISILSVKPWFLVCLLRFWWKGKIRCLTETWSWLAVSTLKTRTSRRVIFKKTHHVQWIKVLFDVFDQISDALKLHFIVLFSLQLKGMLNFGKFAMQFFKRLDLLFNPIKGVATEYQLF